jgi:hypothetical protein
MKKFIILLISIFIIHPQQSLNGCSEGFTPEQCRVYLFNQSILGKNELMPLFYSAEYFYNESWSWYNNQLPENEVSYSKIEQINAQEWKEHTKYKGTLNDIVNVIYRTDIDSMTICNQSFLKKHPFARYLKQKYNAEYQYLIYAKNCEYIYNETDIWELENNDDMRLTDVYNAGNVALKKTKNDFLKLRYAYQLLKINFYHPTIGESVLNIFDTYFKKSQTKTWLFESAKFYYYQTNDLKAEEEQYHLTLSFDKSVDKKFRCVQLFDQKNYLNISKYCQNNHEKAIVHVMHEMQNWGRSLTNLKTIYQLDPSNEYLPFLISREINKLEDWLLTPELTYSEPSIFQYHSEISKSIKINLLSGKKYANDLYSFLNTIIKHQITSNKTQFHVLASNLCILLKDKQKGNLHLKIAEENNTDQKLKYQIMYNKIVLHFDGKSLLTDSLKKQILNLVTYNNQHPDLLINQDVALSQLYLYIGSRLITAGDVANGTLFCSKTTRPYLNQFDWYAQNYYLLLLEKAKPNHFDSIISLIDKPNKTDFDNFILNRKDFAKMEMTYYPYDDTISINKNKVLDYKSMYYVQQDMLDSALSCVNKIDADYWNHYPYNLFKCFPFFTGNSKDYSSNNDFCPYNKRQYLQRMLDLKYLIDNKIGDIAKHYYVLANGYFNMSYHGNYWIMNMPYKYSNEVDYYYYRLTSDSKTFLENYYGSKLAEVNYLKAYQFTSDTTLAALAIHKAGLCNENLQEINWRLTAKYDNEKYEWKNEPKIKHETYKQLFINKYKEKDFYTDFVSNCYHYQHINRNYY